MRSLERILKILIEDYKTRKITKATIDDINARQQLYRGSVKASLGRVYTSDEYEMWKKNVMSKKLP